MAAINIIRPKQAIKKIGVGRSRFYEIKKSDPTFPQSVALGQRARGFIEQELEAWIESKRAEGAK